jgi:Protein of unknown function (DUF1203)
MTAEAPGLSVHAIPADHLDDVRRTGRDVAGNRPVPWPEPAGMPLRCCLRRATADDDVVLISHAPLRERSPWREVGPVFVHAQPCTGYPPAAGLPADLRHGPKVLRGYRADGSLDYDAILTVGAGEEIDGALRELLADPSVHEVHVRALDAQCFTYLVRPDR